MARKPPAKGDRLTGKEKIALAKLRYDLAYRIARVGGYTLATWIIASSFVQGIAALAGQSTSLDVVIGWFTDSAGISITMSFTFGITGTIYGIVQRRQKRTKVEYLSKRIAELEKSLDPNRLSSNIAPDGRTHPDDR